MVVQNTVKNEKHILNMIKKASHTYGLVNLNLFKVFAQLVHIIILILNLTQVHRSSSNRAGLLADQ